MSIQHTEALLRVPLFPAKNKRFILPDLGHILDKWDQGIHPDYGLLTIQLANDLRRIAPNEKVYSVLLGHDYAQVYSRMWPRCDYDTLQLLSHLTMWLVYLDDKVDCKTGDLHGNIPELISYVEKISVFVDECLGLGNIDPSIRFGLDGFVLSFQSIGLRLQSLPLDQMLFFRTSLSGYLDSLIEEQKLAHQGGPQNMQQYMYIRQRTVIMMPVCAVAGLLLSEKARQTLKIRIQEMLPIWKALADAMIFTNDIMSLGNEIHEPEAANAVKVLSLQIPLDKSIDIIVDLLRESVSHFEELSVSFIASAPREHVDFWEEYFASLKSIVAGYYKWR
ncbi:isoprenoid synthase domain-containing protein [Paramyrothecium foliicola]|nr:isoprenoid synthase domain-containing protein [Paramyrothecium foliicola]